MRKIRTGKVYSGVMVVIARNYERLKLLCDNHTHSLFCSKSYEDLFQDTILLVSHDEKASTLSSEEEIIKYFCHRFRMVEFQAINDNKLLKEIPYVDYLQTKEASSEEQ